MPLSRGDAVALCTGGRPEDVYAYDVSPSGAVTVTVHPTSVEPLFIPVTAEKLTAKDLEYTAVKNWQRFRLELMVKPTGPNPTLTYEWPDGALPWPVKVSECVEDTKDKWCTDNFWTLGPATVSITLPKGAEILEFKEWDCSKTADTAPDGRARVTFEVPPGKREQWLGVVYRKQWEKKYSVYGGSPVPVYYPTVLGRYPEYMAQVKHFHDCGLKFYKTYQTDIGFTPCADVSMYLISWVMGYGGAFTSGRIGTYFPYRTIAGFEYPPVRDGSNLIGEYHEMAHAFQPAGYPGFIGGHTWTAYLTREFDWNDFPTVDKVAERKRQGGYPEQESLKIYELFREMHARGLIPGLWYRWPDAIPDELAAFLQERRAPWSLGYIRERAQAGAMIRMGREFGDRFWGRFARTFESSGITYDLDEPVVQKVVAAQMGVAQGRDLTAFLSELTGCDLLADIAGEGGELITVGDGAWQMDGAAAAPLTPSTQGGSVAGAFGAHTPRVRLRLTGPSLEGTGRSHSQQVSAAEAAGTNTLKIQCATPRVAAAVQRVRVEPRTYYLFDAWVRTQGVDQSTSGANLFAGADLSSMDVRGTQGRHRIAMIAYSGDSYEMTVGLRLGRPGQPASGTVWFEDAQMAPLFSKLGWRRLLALGAARV